LRGLIINLQLIDLFLAINFQLYCLIVLPLERFLKFLE